jgi:hypothetical protein
MADIPTIDSLKAEPVGSAQQRPIQSHTAHARIVYWHYTTQHFGDASNLRSLASDDEILGVTTGVIQSEIAGISVEKAMGQPAGTFDITLMPTTNWKQLIAPGDWLVIQMFDQNDSESVTNSHVVTLGNVDRISRSKEKDKKTGKTLVRYHVTGRDFGKVFEDTALYFNPYIPVTSSKSLLDTLLHQKGLYVEGSPDQLVNQAVDLFLSTDGVNLGSTPLGISHIDSLNQWQLPKEVLQFFGSSKSSGAFHDILMKDIWEKLPGHAVRVAMTPGDNAGLWGLLERSANLVVNEMYVDLRHNKSGAAQPVLTLRPRPNSVFFDDSQGALNDNFFSLLDLVDHGNVTTIYHQDIHYDNLGRDGHARFNHIWLHPKMQDAESALNQIGNIGADGGVGNPMQLSESVRRYGLKRSEEQVNFIYVPQGKSVTASVNVVKSFLEQRYDQLAFHHLYETGTVETQGTLEARLGTVLRILPENYSESDTQQNVQAKLYYIEGYKHDWQFPGHWTTEWTLCCGQWESRDRPFIDLSDDDAGQLDTDFDRTSLVKTNVPRGPDDGTQAVGSVNVDGLISSALGAIT